MEVQTVPDHWVKEIETLSCGHTMSVSWLTGHEPIGPGEGPAFCGFCQDWQARTGYAVEWS